MSRRNRLAGALFLLALWLPLLALCLPAPQSKGEFRALAPFPALEASWHAVRAFPRGFEGWFNDHFGLREPLLWIHTHLKLAAGVSPSAKVVIGQERWLFYAAETELEDHLHRVQLTESELALWRDYLEAVRDWLRVQGIDYLFVVAPDKSSIYPEYLPVHLQNPRPGSTRIDQLKRYLAAHSDIAILDLRPALLAAKGPLPLYRRSDTHWNDYGAYIGYRALMAASPLRTQALELPQGVLRKRTVSGDLARMTGAPQEFEEEELALDINDLGGYEACAGELGAGWFGSEPFTTHCARRGGTWLVFRDSFFISMIPYLSESVGTVRYLWERPTAARLAEEVAAMRPELVMDERVERGLSQLPSVAEVERLRAMSAQWGATERQP